MAKLVYSKVFLTVVKYNSKIIVTLLKLVLFLIYWQVLQCCIAAKIIQQNIAEQTL